jgi:hypothetical protein
LVRACGFIHDLLHHLSANTLALETTVYKELREKKRIIACCALQPANISPADSDYSNLRQIPLLSEVDDVSGLVQAQFSIVVSIPAK